MTGAATTSYSPDWLATTGIVCVVVDDAVSGITTAASDGTTGLATVPGTAEAD